VFDDRDKVKSYDGHRAFIPRSVRGLTTIEIEQPSGYPSTHRIFRSIKVDAYISADGGIAVATTTDGSRTGYVEEDEEPLDSRYDFSNIDEDSLQAEVEKVQRFWSEATELHLTDWCDKDEFTYDFWLDRNGHDTGFWDRCPNETIGRNLSDMAKQYGHCDLLEGGDDSVVLSRVHRSIAYR